MHDRIKEVRKQLKLSQTEFGEKLGVTRDMISTYELGRVAPSKLFVDHLCSMFNVNEEWLRTGEGEMFRELKTEEYIIEAFGDLAQQDDGAFAKQFVAALAKLTPEQWKAVEKFAWDVVESQRAALEAAEKPTDK